MSLEDSDSEEEILVYAEFEESVNIDKYRTIHILGADDKNPIIQLDETFFMGKYEHSLGTYMFFEQDHGTQGKDPMFDKYPDKGIKYVYKTRKLLSMEHAYVTPKEGKETNPPSQETQTAADDVQPVTFKDVEQATNAFKSYFISEPTATSISKDRSTDNISKHTNQQKFVEITIDTRHRIFDNVESMNLQNSEISSESNSRNDSDPLESRTEQNPGLGCESTEREGRDHIVTSNLINTDDIQMDIANKSNPDTIKN